MRDPCGNVVFNKLVKTIGMTDSFFDYLTTLFQLNYYTVSNVCWLMNWKGYGRKWSLVVPSRKL